METCKRVIGGANLVCPNLPWMIFPSDDPNDYDGCCGAGETGTLDGSAVGAFGAYLGLRPLPATFTTVGGPSASAPLPSSNNRTVCLKTISWN